MKYRTLAFLQPEQHCSELLPPAASCWLVCEAPVLPVHSAGTLHVWIRLESQGVQPKEFALQKEQRPNWYKSGEGVCCCCFCRGIWRLSTASVPAAPQSLLSAFGSSLLGGQEQRWEWFRLRNCGRCVPASKTTDTILPCFIGSNSLVKTAPFAPTTSYVHCGKQKVWFRYHGAECSHSGNEGSFFDGPWQWLPNHGSLEKKYD